MRIPPNLKYFLLFMLAIAFIVAATLYLHLLIPNIGSILTGAITVVMFVLIFFVFVKPFIGFLYARMDGIFKVHMDVSEKGFHIFGYHLTPGGDGMSGTRDIQHYYIVIETGKLYYRKLFSHDMTPSEGRSGWGDFYSFEENVIASKQMENSLLKLSKKASAELRTGREINAFGDEEYEIRTGSYLILIKKFSSAADEGYQIICTDTQSSRQLWRKKI